MEEQITKIVNDNPDSLEIGTPAKGGAIKVYGNFSKPEEFEVKILNAIKVRTFANNNME